MHTVATNCCQQKHDEDMNDLGKHCYHKTSKKTMRSKKAQLKQLKQQKIM